MGKNDGLTAAHASQSELERNVQDAKCHIEASVLRLSEERFRQLAEIAPVGIFRASADGRVNYVNRFGQVLCGLPAADLLDMNWLAAVVPAERSDAARNWATAVRGGLAYQTELRLRRPDGSDIWVIVRAKPEHDATGTVTGYIGTATDITDRKQAEWQMREQLDELRRFQRITVERELHLQELEEEVRNLKKARN